jgi:hypothetical protein
VLQDTPEYTEGRAPSIDDAVALAQRARRRNKLMRLLNQKLEQPRTKTGDINDGMGKQMIPI